MVAHYSSASCVKIGDSRTQSQKPPFSRLLTAGCTGFAKLHASNHNAAAVAGASAPLAASTQHVEDCVKDEPRVGSARPTTRQGCRQERCHELPRSIGQLCILSFRHVPVSCHLLGRLGRRGRNRPTFQTPSQRPNAPWRVEIGQIVQLGPRQSRIPTMPRARQRRTPWRS